MTRSINVDFFQVETPEGISFADLVDSVNIIPIERRNHRYGIEAPVRMQTAVINGDNINGDMIRIRMDEVPLKASLQGGTEFITLRDDEGIGEDTAFFYFKPFNVLLLQRNRYAVSASAFALYFKTMCDVNYIFLNPILRTDIMLRLRQMSIFRKFNVKIAGIQNSEMFRGHVGGVGSIIDCKDQYEAPNITVNVSMGRARGSLSLGNVMESIQYFFRISHDNNRMVKKLDVFAQEDYTSEIEYLDILKARIVEKIDVNLDHNRRLPYENRSQALSDAWSRRRGELSTRFSSEEG